MAKHRRKKPHRVTRRRSHARVSGLDITTVLSAVAGGIGANALNKVIPTTINPKIIAGLKIGAGLLMPMLVKAPSAKNIASGLGTGMAVVGTLDLLKQFNVLNGVDDDILRIELAGADDLNVINGEDMSIINGSNEFDQV